MKKKIILGSLFLITLLGLFVIADYLEILPGVPCVFVDGGISVPCKFQFLDLKQKPVDNVAITASLNDYNLGDQFEYKYDNDGPSLVFGRIFFPMGWKSTLFFKKSNPNRSVSKREVKFVFQHPDYLEQEKTFLVKNLKKEAHTIILQPKEQRNEKNNGDSKTW